MLTRKPMLYRKCVIIAVSRQLSKLRTSLLRSPSTAGSATTTPARCSTSAVRRPTAGAYAWYGRCCPAEACRAVVSSGVRCPDLAAAEDDIFFQTVDRADGGVDVDQGGAGKAQVAGPPHGPDGTTRPHGRDPDDRLRGPRREKVRKRPKAHGQVLDQRVVGEEQGRFCLDAFELSWRVRKLR